MKDGVAVVHIAPVLGARFTQYTAELEAGGGLGAASAQRFCFVMEGSVNVEADDKLNRLGVRGYVYVPEGLSHHIKALEKSRIMVIEKPYEPLNGVRHPDLLSSNEDKITAHALGDDPGLQVKNLLPEDTSFDFAVNTMVYQPGAALSMVEMHVMEHGLVMLEGGGIYRLGDSWYPVTAGDFIWMAPWCPQWFGAIGKVPAKYLIYKEWNRNPSSDIRK